MMTTLAARNVRRLPALLLVPCLLLMGGLVTRAPASDGVKDSMSAPAHVVRAPVVRAAAPPGHTPVAIAVSGVLLPLERVVRESGDHGHPVVVLRSTPRTFHLSRAPPASL